MRNFKQPIYLSAVEVVNGGNATVRQQFTIPVDRGPAKRMYINTNSATVANVYTANISVSIDGVYVMEEVPLSSLSQQVLNDVVSIAINAKGGGVVTVEVVETGGNAISTKVVFEQDPREA